MADIREEILIKCDEGDGLIFDGNGNISFYEGKIQSIYNAMDENGKRLCLELLEYMAKNNITCSILFDEPRFYYNGQYLTKELLFENFL